MTHRHRPDLPFTRLHRRYPSDVRLTFRMLADAYTDARLQDDPRNIVGRMLPLLGSTERRRQKDLHQLHLLLRALNTPVPHGFFCPVCYETRFDRLPVSSKTVRHAHVVIASAGSVVIVPAGCEHREIGVECDTCGATWQPEHTMTIGGEPIVQPPNPTSEMN